MGRMTTTHSSLLRRVCRPEDAEAWAEFVATYEPLVRNYVRSKSHSRGRPLEDSDLDDVVQHVWINLWRTAGDFSLDRERGRFRTFLYTVTVNALTDYRRRQARHFKKRTSDVDGDLPDPRSEPDAEWEQAYQQAILQRVFDQIREELLRDNPNKWRCFEEQGLKGRKAAEVAAELHVSPDLVYQNTKRVMELARGRCRALYEEDLADDRA